MRCILQLAALTASLMAGLAHEVMASKVMIYASGKTGQETMELQVKRETVRTFRKVPQLPVGTYRKYQYATPDRLSISNLRVLYSNDGVHQGKQMSLRVDRINLDGVDYYSIDPSTYSTGTVDRETGLTPGYKQSRQLHQNGYFRYSRTAPATNPSSDSASSSNDWTLTFFDNFSGTQLNTNKWNNGSAFGIVNGEEQAYLPEQVKVSGGMLRIHADKTPTRFNNRTQPFRSGMITTRGKFQQRYGKYEIRAKLPNGRGYWPAFWTLEVNPAVFQKEIDIMETIGSRPNLSSFNYHHPDANDRRQSYYGQWIGPDFTKAFHVYTLEWTPSQLVWFIDGVERYRLERPAVPVPRVNMYLIINLAVGGIFPEAVDEPPDNTTPQRGTLLVDYVRVYER